MSDFRESHITDVWTYTLLLEYTTYLNTELHFSPWDEWYEQIYGDHKYGIFYEFRIIILGRLFSFFKILTEIHKLAIILRVLYLTLSFHTPHEETSDGPSWYVRWGSPQVRKTTCTFRATASPLLEVARSVRGTAGESLYRWSLEWSKSLGIGRSFDLKSMGLQVDVEFLRGFCSGCADFNEVVVVASAADWRILRLYK